MHLFDCLVRRVVRWSSGFKCLLKLVQPFLKSCDCHRPLSQTVCSYSPLFLIRLPVPPNVHRCELRLARMEISNYAPYIKERFEKARQHSILHPERIVGKPSLIPLRKSCPSPARNSALLISSQSGCRSNRPCDGILSVRLH